MTYLRRLRRRIRRLRRRIANGATGLRDNLRRARRKLRWLLRYLRIDWNGKQSVPLLRRVVRYTDARGLVVTSTTGGVHSPTSYHYQRRAVDVAGGSAAHMAAVQRGLLRKFGAGYFRELFGPAGFYVKNGVRYSGHFPAHHDHIHAAR